LSSSDVMSYRMNIAAVRWPLILMAIDCGTPARTMLRTADRRRSWKSTPGTPALRHAVAQERLKSVMAFPSPAWKTYSEIAVSSAPDSFQVRLERADGLRAFVRRCVMRSSSRSSTVTRSSFGPMDERSGYTLPRDRSRRRGVTRASAHHGPGYVEHKSCGADMCFAQGRSSSRPTGLPRGRFNAADRRRQPRLRRDCTRTDPRR
jgi:hypothetical protein